MKDLKDKRFLCKKLVSSNNCQLYINLIIFIILQSCISIGNQHQKKEIRASTPKKKKKKKKKILLCSLISHHLSKKRLLEYYLLKKPSVANNPGLS